MPENTTNATKNNLFYCLQTKTIGSPYGARLWIPSDRETLSREIQDHLGHASMWGNHDKVGESCAGWEFRSNEYMHEAARVLREQFGFAEIADEKFFEKYPY